MGVRLEHPSKSREAEFLLAVRRSRKLHRGRVSPPCSRAEYAEYLTLARSHGTAVFFVVIAETDQIAGVVHLEHISSGASRSANLGFYGFEPFVGRGLMREGVDAVVSYAFRGLRLHRLEANVQPDNAASRALIRRLGFELEGYSPRFLKVGGRWRDHERWAILAERWRARPGGARRSAPEERLRRASWQND